MTTEPPPAELAQEDLPLDELRSARRRLTGEVQRLSWLRRLVVARSDLEVARLTGLDGLTAPSHLEPAVREALALGEVSGPELLRSLSTTARELDDASRLARAELDVLTDRLVDRLAVDPASCLDL